MRLSICTFDVVPGGSYCEGVARTSASARILAPLILTVYTLYTGLCSNLLICIHPYLRFNMENKIARIYTTKYRQQWMFD